MLDGHLRIPLCCCYLGRGDLLCLSSWCKVTFRGLQKPMPAPPEVFAVLVKIAGCSRTQPRGQSGRGRFPEGVFCRRRRVLPPGRVTRREHVRWVAAPSSLGSGIIAGCFSSSSVLSLSIAQRTHRKRKERRKSLLGAEERAGQRGQCLPWHSHVILAGVWLFGGRQQFQSG